MPNGGPGLKRLTVLAERDGGWWCHYCDTALSVDLEAEEWQAATADHVIPRAHGGPDALGNLVLSCRRCNRQRGHLGYAKFRRDRGLPARPDVLARAEAARQDGVAARAAMRAPGYHSHRPPPKQDRALIPNPDAYPPLPTLPPASPVPIVGHCLSPSCWCGGRRRPAEKGVSP